MLIANLSGHEVTVDVFVGIEGAHGAGKHTTDVKNNALGRIDLQPDDANSHLIVSATDDIILQLVIDDGRVNGVTCLPVF